MSSSSAMLSPSSRDEEPPMLLQRPSSASCQDVSHLLSSTFRHLYLKDAIAPDTVDNLMKSRGGDDEYHEKYVSELQKVCLLRIYAIEFMLC